LHHAEARAILFAPRSFT